MELITDVRHLRKRDSLNFATDFCHLPHEAVRLRHAYSRLCPVDEPNKQAIPKSRNRDAGDAADNAISSADILVGKALNFWNKVALHSTELIVVC